MMEQRIRDRIARDVAAVGAAIVLVASSQSPAHGQIEELEDMFGVGRCTAFTYAIYSPTLFLSTPLSKGDGRVTGSCPNFVGASTTAEVIADMLEGGSTAAYARNCAAQTCTARASESGAPIIGFQENCVLAVGKVTGAGRPAQDVDLGGPACP